MNLRLHERMPADIEIRVANLTQGEAAGTSTAWMLDASKSGIAMLTRTRFGMNDTVRLDFQDCQLFGHIIYVTEEDGGMFRTGVSVEEVLLGRSDLARLVEALSAASQPVPQAQEQRLD